MIIAAILLLASETAWGQPSCIPASIREHYVKSASKTKPRRWLAAGDAKGKTVVVAIDDAIWSTLSAFDVETGKVKWTKPLLAQVSELQVSPDGEQIAFAANTTFCRASKIQLWRTRNGEPIVEKLPGWVDQQGYSVAFSPDSKLLAGSMNGQVAVWDAANGKMKREIEPPGFETKQGIERISNLKFDSKASSVTGRNGKGDIYTWSVPSGKVISKKGPAKGKQTAAESSKGFSYSWPASSGYWKMVSWSEPAPSSELKLVLIDGTTGKTRQQFTLPPRP